MGRCHAACLTTSLLVACGRVGFDARLDAGGDTGVVVDAPISAGLLIWYRFEDDFNGASEAMDESGAYPAVCGACPASMTGRTGSGAYFDGNESFEVPSVVSSLNLQAYTVASWIRPERRPSDFEMIVARPYGMSSEDSFAMNLTSGGRLESYTEPGGSLVGTATAPLDTWTHVAITYDGTTKTLFVGGVFDGSEVVPGPVVYDGHPLTIGADISSSTTDHFFLGTIDEIMIFDRALVDTELAMLAQ